MASKAGKQAKADRHRPHSMVRVPKDVYGQLRVLAARRELLISQVLRRALVKELEAEGLWPPAGEKGA